MILLKEERVDDLGRVVIPKEIRKALKIDEGDAIEIYCDTTREKIEMKKLTEVNEEIKLEELINNKNSKLDKLAFDIQKYLNSREKVTEGNLRYYLERIEEIYLLGNNISK